MRDALASGALSAVEVCRIALDRVEATNPTLNAFNHVAAERALARAEAIDRAGAAAAAPIAGGTVALARGTCRRVADSRSSSRRSFR